MKQILVILVAMSLLLQTNSKLVFIADYYLNKDYIAKNLCENRNKPEMNCCGKCCLKKKLVNDEKDQSPSSGSQRGKEEVTLYYSPFSIEVVTYATTTIITEYSSYTAPLVSSSPGALLRPPQV